MKKVNNTQGANGAKAYLHGECIIKQIDELPAGLVTMSRTDEAARKHPGFIVLAPSEQTGNDHVLELPTSAKKGKKSLVSVFRNKDGKIFFQTEAQVNVRCMVKERHDTITLDPGCYEVGAQQEYDYFTQSLQAVRD